MSGDLRQRLTEALRHSPNAPWLRVGDADLTPSYIDALMPAITQALADAWDHGHRSVNPTIPDAHRDVVNPWKQP